MTFRHHPTKNVNAGVADYGPDKVNLSDKWEFFINFADLEIISLK